MRESGIRWAERARCRRGWRSSAAELGVVFHTSTDVAQILTDAPRNKVAGGKVTGLVTTDGVVHRFDAVVSNSDAVRTHRELVGGAAAREFEHKRSYEPACSWRGAVPRAEQAV